MFGFYMMDIYYLVLVVPALIIAMIAQVKVQNSFTKYSKIHAKSNVTADSVIRDMLNRRGLSQITVGTVQGTLSDHFDPKANTIRLSEPVYGSSSIAAIGVAAHEAGHAMQRQNNYLPIKIRNSILPVVNFASYAAIPLAMIGLVFGNILLEVGVIMFASVVLFQIITLPVEFNASKLALESLSENGILDNEELKGAKKVLSAAAMTYVASALVAVMNLLRLILIANRRRD